MKEPKKREPMSTGAKISLGVMGLVVVAVAVFGTLWVVTPRYDYLGAMNYTSEIFGTRDSLAKYFEAKAEKAELTEAEIDLFEAYKNGMKKNSNYMESLRASDVLKIAEISEVYEQASGQFEQLKKVYATEEKLYEMVEDGEFSDDELAEMAKMDNKFLQEIGKNLQEYRKKIVEFNEKYKDAKNVNKTQMDADYAQLSLESQNFGKKYAEISFDDLYEMSSDDFFAFYDTIEELKQLIAEKI